MTSLRRCPVLPVAGQDVRGGPGLELTEALHSDKAAPII